MSSPSPHMTAFLCGVCQPSPGLVTLCLGGTMPWMLP